MGTRVLQHCQILNESGVQRHFGPASLGQRLALIARRSDGSLFWNRGKERYQLTTYLAQKKRPSRSDTTPIEDMWLRISTPAMKGAMTGVAALRLVAKLEAELKLLPGWAAMGPGANYIRGHVLRKARNQILDLVGSLGLHFLN